MRIHSSVLTIILLILTVTQCMKLELYNDQLLKLIPLANLQSIINSGLLSGKVATPLMDPPPGLITTLSNISITTETPGAIIYYTTNGTNPSANSDTYNAPLENIWSLAGINIQAIATKPGMADSDLVSATYSYPPLKTGQGACWDNSGIPQSCPGTGHDGETQAGLNRQYSYNLDGTVRDLVTGLTWQRCSHGQNNDTVCSGSATTLDWTAAQNYCNGLNLAGKVWRLPSIQELATFVYHTNPAPLAPNSYFPNTIQNEYWTSTTSAFSPSKAWTINFNDGSFTNIFNKTTPYHVRCVSGPVKPIIQNFQDNGDGTVTDRATGLVWQKCSAGQSNNASCSGTPTTYTFTASATYCKNLTLAGRTWRLPNPNELFSIVDITKNSVPTIKTEYFPNTSDYYWTSTTYEVNNYEAFFVYFDDGSVNPTNKSGSYKVRCVSGP